MCIRDRLKPLRSIHCSRPDTSLVACDGPYFRSDDVVITTSAPASRYFTTSSDVSTPDVPASEARTRPYSAEIHVRGSRPENGVDRSTVGSSWIDSTSTSGWKNWLNS